MNIKRISSPNCDHIEIPVEYLVLHYTAVDLQETLQIFTTEGGVSAHLVIDVDGTAHELVDCLQGKAHRAWHAGVSRWHEREAFNDFAIGIELVNYNGNIFPYTDAQYDSLFEIVQQLQALYPALNDPERILGHEQIAGFRGKADPGICFDWHRFYQHVCPNQMYPARHSICSKELQQQLLEQAGKAPETEEERSAFWKKLSQFTEERSSRAT
ncbi:N-acetylmuramoyl-L-alanine amidase [Endozoicomonas sp. OPT23]|uniref:N-acetylmuramoyl-L-alanine amidase n=1 Tax=Endozoicomonas sp. OPT23 TaxID=2072845 RepID=UPI001DAFA57D|nr:N-acetylmuramoyl-L-alanine amidase [Endozoicomonas sp. OPT23]